MRIAILGTRGIPARYGGFETFAEELSRRLVKKGHEVIVYCRRRFGENKSQAVEYEGVRLIYTPTLMHKYFETPLHALSSFLDLMRRRVDAALLCNAANSPFAWVAKLGRVPLLINVDGIERKRAKWNFCGRLWYRLGERCSVWFADRVVADARTIAAYYLQSYSCKAEVIAYGAEAVPLPPGEVLGRFGLQPRRYLLYVSRLEPENNALGVVQAYGRLNTEMPLVVVGDAPYAKGYIAKVKAAAPAGVIFTGYQFGASYRELCSNCYLYIQASEVGGTHPALVENMAHGNCIVANYVPEHLEVLGDAGVYYRYNNFEDLAHQLRGLLEDAERVREYGSKARKRAAQLYRWEDICEQYEALFREVVG